MNYSEATNCGFCGREVKRSKNHLIDSGKVFCDENCVYLYDYNHKFLNKENKDDKSTNRNST